MSQAGLLAFGSPYLPRLPTWLNQAVTSCGFRPRLQRRARSRFSRDSLLCLKGTWNYPAFLHLSQRMSRKKSWLLHPFNVWSSCPDFFL